MLLLPGMPELFTRVVIEVLMWLAFHGLWLF
jgi:hypothetical protein